MHPVFYLNPVFRLVVSPPGVLKCKKDRALPGGQLCAMCSSPKHLHRKDLQTVENLVCSSPVINSPHKTSPPDEAQSEVLTIQDFREPFGNISMGLTDEHGNEVELECSLSEPRELTRISWEQVDPLHLTSNISFAVDLECVVDRERYERLWRLIAYYSSVPAHLQRSALLRKEPHPTYVYRQDSEKDAQYYTGVKVNMMTQPPWLMQKSAGLQLNRLQSSARTVKLILSSDVSETVEAELVRRQRRTWVMIESTNATRKALSAILGRPSQMDCNVQSSGEAVVHWVLPDGSKVAAPHSSSDNRVSVSSEGRLVIQTVSHSDAGIYYCIAKVHGDLAVSPFHLSVQESSNSPPGGDASVTPVEGFAGSPISLPCTASASPDAEVDWILPSSSIVNVRANSSRASVYPNGTLYIPQSQISDSGFYKCIAVNQHGVDTLAAKVSVIRKPGLVRPLRKFPPRPQSAAGINTQIQVPTEGLEEGSGDAEPAPKNPTDATRRRIPGGVAPGRRGVHPSRNVWRRPVQRKPTGSRDDDRKSVVDSRRKINVSKTKIDPEKWADILAKIRDRNTQNVVTATTERSVTEPATTTQETFEGSSEGQDGFTTTHAPELQVTTHSPTTHDSTSNSWNSVQATAEPNTAQTTFNVQHTSTASNSVLLLPQTTSGPLHAVTLWQPNTNTASRSLTESVHEKQSTNTDVDGDTTADQSKVAERREDMDEVSVAASSNNDREVSVSGSEVISEESEPSREENPSTSRPHALPEDTPHPDLTMLTTASPTTTLTPQRTPPTEPPNSRRRNGGRRRRPNRRRQKLNKPQHDPVTTAAPLRTTAPTQPLTEASGDARVSTPAPSQARTSGRLSHRESTVSEHDDKLSIPSSPPSLQTEAKPRFKSTSAAPSFPASSPGAGHGKTRAQTAMGISERAELDETVTTSQGMFTEQSRPLPPARASEEEDEEVRGDRPASRDSSRDLQTVTQVQTDVKLNQSGLYLTDKDGGAADPLLSTSAPLLIQHEATTTSGYTFSTQSVIFTSLGTEVTTEVDTVSATLQEVKDTSTESEAGTHLEGASDVSVIRLTTPRPDETPSLGAETSPSPQTTTTEGAGNSPDQQRTSETPLQSSPTHYKLSPEPTSASRKVTTEQTNRPTSPPASTTQTHAFTERLLTSTQDASREQQVPEPGPAPRGKPRIMKSNFQTVSVRAETDAQLPCEAVGEPMPFLSWTKVASGMYESVSLSSQCFQVLFIS